MSRPARIAAAVVLSALALRIEAAPPAAASAPRAAPATSAPSEFAGRLDAGNSYVAEVYYDANALHIWRPAKDVQVAKNNAWTIDWVNLAAYPALRSASVRARPQRFRFKVLSAAVSSGSPKMPWTEVYRCEVLAVEPVAVPPAALRKR
jgi:hypothetical protein